MKALVEMKEETSTISGTRETRNSSHADGAKAAVATAITVVEEVVESTIRKDISRIQ